jgi:hypothetical protein
MLVSSLRYFLGNDRFFFFRSIEVNSDSILDIKWMDPPIRVLILINWIILLALVAYELLV